MLSLKIYILKKYNKNQYFIFYNVNVLKTILGLHIFIQINTSFKSFLGNCYKY